MREVRIKCVLLGNEATGKTSIVDRYTRGVFNQYSQSTIGAAFNAKPLTKKDFTVKLDIWDTAGQERYRSMTPMYYRNADIAFVCVDLSSNNIESSFDYWIKALKQYSDIDNRIVYLVGTKTDIKKPELCDLQVSNILERHPSVKFIETSSKKNTNINRLFDVAVEDALESYRENKTNPLSQALIISNNDNNSKSFFGLCNIL